MCQKIEQEKASTSRVVLHFNIFDVTNIQNVQTENILYL